MMRLECRIITHRTWRPCNARVMRVFVFERAPKTMQFED